MPAAILRASGYLHWIVFFAAITVAWLILFLMAVPADLRSADTLFGSGFIQNLCNVSFDQAGFLRVAAMWGIMSLGMMAPTALPAFKTYDDLSHTTTIRFGSLVSGYLIVWIGFSLLAAALQLALFRLDLIGTFGQSRSTLLTGLLLIGAGAYQFSTLKDACLSKCRMPLTFFMQHWDEGPFRNGVRLGLACLGCCWALMLLAFVGGVMNLAFMGLAMVVMATEKLPDLGRRITAPLGYLLLATGGWMALTPLV